MEKLLETNIKQTVPTFAVVFIIANIIILFSVIIGVLLLTIRGILVDNIIYANVVVTGLFMVLGNLVLIATGVASIKDYKRVMRKSMNDFLEVEKHCNDLIQQTVETSK